MDNRLQEVTDTTFEQEVLQQQERAVLVDFWAPWCGPCQGMMPHVQAIAADHGERLKVVKLNVDDNAQTAAQYGIRSIPTLLLFHQGKLADQRVGALDKSQIVALVSPYL